MFFENKNSRSQVQAKKIACPSASLYYFQQTNTLSVVLLLHSGIISCHPRLQSSSLDPFYVQVPCAYNQTQLKGYETELFLSSLKLLELDLFKEMISVLTKEKYMMIQGEN
ncbi:hypothetical protein Scep_007479 [Stephania cephalantha]|uniref:Uncharacterized protein n=1 Tax=Stephania cephalantha TaxID=152367 RepID=A0AAP0KA60_9MAGN